MSVVTGSRRRAARPAPSLTLHALLYAEAGRTIAHVLETNTVSEGETPAAALDGAGEALRIEFAYDAGEPRSAGTFGTPAPTACWVALRSARPAGSTKLSLPGTSGATLLAYRIDEPPRA